MVTQPVQCTFSVPGTKVRIVAPPPGGIVFTIFKNIGQNQCVLQAWRTGNKLDDIPLEKNEAKIVGGWEVYIKEVGQGVPIQLELTVVGASPG